ncbi:MAG: hypothetical protein AVO38_12905 [delta proteobacterium ML8_D]|nr:MAG: hypothetical protein AVO38_12905 [delta proteobacterium ML8_D]
MGTPWRILEGTPGLLTFSTSEPISRWDFCLKELQNRVYRFLPRDINAATEWEVMPLKRYNFLKDKKSVHIGRSWIAVSPRLFLSNTQILKSHEASSKKIIFLSPGRAFGDGCHPSIQGSVNALQYLHEHNLVRDKSVLDIGTGTGILAIIAGKMEARSVICLDIDREATRVARKNIRRNGLDSVVSVTQGTVEDLTPGKWNLALANLTISVMIKMLGKIVKLLTTPGFIVMSGFKSTGRGEVAKLIRRYCLEVIWSEEQAGWVTSIVRQG